MEKKSRAVTRSVRTMWANATPSVLVPDHTACLGERTVQIKVSVPGIGSRSLSWKKEIKWLLLTNHNN